MGISARDVCAIEKHQTMKKELKNYEEKNLFAFVLCVIMAVTMAVPAFAAESETGILNIPIGSSIQPRTDVGSQYFQIEWYVSLLKY